LILYANSEVMMTRTRLPMPHCLWGGGYGAKCSAGTEHGHSARSQWPVIPTVPYLGRYGIDVTSCLVGRSTVSSRHPANIAGVVGALMGRDALSGRLAEAEATGCCRAGFERDGESTSRPRLLRAGPWVRRRIGSPSRPPVRDQEQGRESVGFDEAGV